MYSYLKLTHLKLKKEKGETNSDKPSKYEIQATQEEPFFNNIKISLKNIKISCEKDELIEINSKPILSKKSCTKSKEEQEEDKTIENPQSLYLIALSN